MTMSRDAVSLELIAGIYQAALQPAEWGKILESIAALFDGHAAFTMRVGFGAHDSPDLFFHNLPAESFVAYGEHYYQHDLWSPPWISQGLHGLGNVYSGEQLVERSVFKRSVWFNEFLKPLDIEHSMFASLSEHTPAPAILVIDRPLGAEPFSHEDMARLHPIAAHLTQAMAIGRRFQAMNEALQAQEQSLETLKQAVISISANGKVLYANGLAEERLARRDGLTIKGGLLVAMTEQGNRELAHLLIVAKQGLGHTFMLERLPPYPPLRIQSLPQFEAEVATGLPPAGRITLLLSDDVVPESDAYQRFVKSYRLTRQETKVLQSIVEGFSAKEIAERHAVSYNTVRSQLASLMQKTDCRRQKDLIRLFLRDDAGQAGFR